MASKMDLSSILRFATRLTVTMIFMETAMMVMLTTRLACMLLVQKIHGDSSDGDSHCCISLYVVGDGTVTLSKFITVAAEFTTQ